MTELERLTAKHRTHGLLIDSNLLVLLLVGRTSRRRVLNSKRTHNYTVEDYDLLEIFVKQFPKLVTTPHILTEVSNLTDLADEELRKIRALFIDCITPMREVYVASSAIVLDKTYGRFGLTDAAISISTDELVLTDDLALWLALSHLRIDALNFNHLREWYWQLTS